MNYYSIELKVKGYINRWRIVGFYVPNGRKMKNALKRYAYPYSQDEIKDGFIWQHNGETYRLQKQ